MEIFVKRKFIKQFNKLPKETRQMALKKEIIFRESPFHPSLKTHKLKGHFKNYWSFSINREYRVIFQFINKDFVKFDYIGNHKIYN